MPMLGKREVNDYEYRKVWGYRYARTMVLCYFLLLAGVFFGRLHALGVF